MTRHLHRLEALVLTLLMLPLVLLARLVSWARTPRLAQLIPEPCPPAPAAPLPVAPMVVAACASTAPAAGRVAPALEGLTVHELRRLAQAKGITTAGGKRTSKANRRALLEVLA